MINRTVKSICKVIISITFTNNFIPNNTYYEAWTGNLDQKFKKLDIHKYFMFV